MINASRQLSRLSRLVSRRLLLLSFDWTRPKDPPMSLGQASILAKLQQESVPVIAKSWSVNQPQFNIDQVVSDIMTYADDQTDIAMGAFVWHEPQTQALLSALKNNRFPGKIIMGGPQISYTKKGLESYYPQADIFIRGYGEDALAKLLQSTLSKPSIAGVHYAGEPDLGFSANVELEELPSPYLEGVIKPQRFIRWETQRGCPFRCAFCQHRESDVTMQRRQFNEGRIMQEVEWILSNPIIQDIAVLDPTFNSGPHYLTILEALVRGKYTGKLALQCRIEMVKEPFLDLVQQLNETATVVLEFGLQTTNRQEAALIQRPNNLHRVKRVLTETKRREIATEVSLIFGLPNQTVQSFQASIDFCKEYGVPTIYAYPLMLLRGTPLHDAKSKLQLIESSDVDIETSRVQVNIPHVIACPSFTVEDWHTMAAMASSLDDYNRLANRTPKKMQSTLSHTSFWSKKEKAQHFDTAKNDLESSLSC